MNRILLVCALVLASAGSALAYGGLYDRWFARGMVAGFEVTRAPGGRPLRCHGRVSAWDRAGIRHNYVGRFWFGPGDVGPHGLAVVSNVAPMVSVEYTYECRP